MSIFFIYKYQHQDISQSQAVSIKKLLIKILREINMCIMKCLHFFYTNAQGYIKIRHRLHAQVKLTI